MQTSSGYIARGYRMGGFLISVLVLQLLVWILSGFKAAGVDIPVLTPIIGFVYLTFIPGILILRILRIHGLSLIEVVAYSVGLSLSFLMIVGFLLNIGGLLIGIDKPLATLPLIIATSVLVLILCGISFKRNRVVSDDDIVNIKMNLRQYSSPSFYFLLLLPLISILGATLVNYSQNNILLLVFICLIGITVILVCFTSLIPSNLYPVAILCISLALLYHSVLISNYLTGWDVHLEYYFARLTAMHSYWDSSLAYMYNANMSVTILPTIYFNFLNFDILWIFKLVYPILFSLVPLLLYKIYRQQMHVMVAFLAVFFFMAIDVFFGVMTSLMKQQIAEVFFALLILLMLSSDMNRSKRIILAIIFSFSLIVSHYATSYIYLFYAVLVWIIMYIVSFFRKSQSASLITGGLVLFFLVMVITWYMYLASSETFAEVVNIGNYMYRNFSDFLIGGSRELVILRLLGLSEPAHIVGANVYRFTQLIIIVGVIILVFRYRQLRFHTEYIVMTFISLLLLFICIVLPYFAEFLHVDRFYHITLFFLSPFFILGGQYLFKWLFSPFAMIKRRAKKQYELIKGSETSEGQFAGVVYLRMLVIIVVIPYFLFTSGFIYEVTQDKVPTSIALSQARYENSNVNEVLEEYYSGYTYKCNVYSARWLSEYGQEMYDVCCDRLSTTWILPSYGLIIYAYPIDADTEIPVNSYLYLSRLNVVRGVMAASTRSQKYGSYYTFTYATDELSRLMNTRIYTNGQSEIYQYR